MQKEINLNFFRYILFPEINSISRPKDMSFEFISKSEF
jgi:hypothetical protein